MHRLDATITLYCNNFTNEGITNEMFLESKVFRISEIVENLCNKVTKLESQVTPNTPPEVL